MLLLNDCSQVIIKVVLDRVVNVSRNCAVPLGLRGTVIGISKGEIPAVIIIVF